MRFKLDENLRVELLGDLRVAGHEADGLHDEGLIGDIVVLTKNQLVMSYRIALASGKECTPRTLVARCSG